MKKVSLLALALSGLIAPSFAQTVDRQYSLQIERQPLVATLRQLSEQTGLQLVGLLGANLQEEARVVGPLNGDYTAEAALNELLAQSDLVFKRVNERTIAIISRNSVHRSSNQENKAHSFIPLKAEGDGRTSWQPINAAAESSTTTRSAAMQRSELRSGQSLPRAGVEQFEDVEELVVTGSHIRGAQAAGAKVVVLERQQIMNSGHSRLQDVLGTMTQNFKGASEEFNQPNSNINFGADVQLRGLGPGTTLTLVNGLRQPAGGAEGGFIDISSIPVAAIERVEVLTDGASAIYGSDAIGGVVNIILRDDFDGAESRVRVGSAGGEGDELQVSQVFGGHWDNGSGLFGYQYSKRDAVAASSRRYSALNGDMRRYGGSDFRELFQRYAGSPGTILDPATFLPAFAIPSGQDGTALDPNDLIAGVPNYTDMVSNTEIFPDQRMHSAFFNASYNITEQWKINGTARYSARDADRDVGPRNAIVMVPSTNPFYVDAFGDGQPLFVSYDFARDLGPLRSVAETDTYTSALSLAGPLVNDWQLKITATYGKEKVDQLNDYVSGGSAALAQALADSDPATALNVFGDGAANNPATLASIRTLERTLGTSSVWSTGVTADGPLFSLSGRDVRFALGADYRKERLRIENVARNVPDDRGIAAAFTELTLPLLAARSSGDGAMDLSVAARYEDYDDFGSTFDPKVGVTFKPLRSLAVRGTWGTSFRAPPFYQSNIAISGGNFASADFVPDPSSPTGSAMALTLYGNNEDLKEESAEVWTFGFDFAPEIIRGMTISASYFDITYDDKIQANAADLVLEDQFVGLITRNPTQAQIDAICNDPGYTVFGDCTLPIAAILDSRVRNTSVVKVNGLDFDMAQAFSSAVGDWSVNIGATYTFHHRRAFTRAAPTDDVIDTFQNPLRLRMRGGIQWTQGPWIGGALVYFSDSYRNTQDIPQATIGSFTTVDLTFGARIEGGEEWFGNSEVTLNATNVLDEVPPFVDVPSGYDGANSSSLGRVLSLQLVKTW